MKTTFTRMGCRCLLIAVACCVLPGVGWGQTGPDVWDGTTIASGFSGGDGSDSDPYQINTGAELAYLAQEVNNDNSAYNDKSYKLTNDINLNNQAWTPIGTSSYPFKGSFDGDNHTISNLYVPEQEGSNMSLGGFFGYISAQTNITIKNLGVSISELGITGTYYVGGLIGDMGSSGSITITISNCVVTGSLIDAKYRTDVAYAGGLIGNISASSATINITNCYTCINTITARTDYGAAYAVAGGIVGRIGSGTLNLTNCFSLCKNISAYAPNSNSPEAGNLVGYDSGYGISKTYTNCFSSPLTAITTDAGPGPVTTYPTASGGNDKNGVFLTQDNFNDSSGNALAGWESAGWHLNGDKLPTLAAGAASPAIDEFIWSGDGSQSNPYQIKNEKLLRIISIQTNAASPSYQDKHYIMTNSVELTSDWTPIKDFSGAFDGDGYVISELNIPESMGAETAGVFASLKSGAAVSNLGVMIKTEVTANGGAAESGGIAGKCESGASIERCFVAGGKITGLSAGNITGSNAGTIKDCYATTEVAGVANALIGGICGTNTGTIQNSYAVAKIAETDASNKAGGISGSNTGTIENCLALNKEGITGTAGQGRITGENTGTLIGNYAYPLIPGTWSNEGTDQADGAAWEEDTYPFPASRTITVWDMTTDATLLPRLQAFIDKGTQQPADNLQKASYQAFKVTLTQPTEGGTISVTYTGGQLSDGDTYIPINTELALAATPAVGYRFKTYTANGASISDKHTVIANVTLSAVFEPLYTVTITQPDPAEGSFTATYSGTTLSDGANADIPDGTVLTLVATPANGYRPKAFTADGTPIGDYSYTVNADVTLSATFEPIPSPPPPPVIPDPDPTPTPPIYHTVTLPAVDGATTDPVAGEYPVRAWDDFTFHLTLKEEYNESEPVVSTSLGAILKPRSSDGAYILKDVRQPVEIVIEGIVKNPDPVGNEPIETDAVKVWAVKGYLYINTATAQTVQVYNLAGSLVKQADIPSGDTCWQLPSGIYIVRIDNRPYKIVM